VEKLAFASTLLFQSHPQFRHSRGQGLLLTAVFSMNRLFLDNKLGLLD
jgi:hypothetical protein